MSAEQAKAAAPELEDGYAAASTDPFVWFGYYVPPTSDKLVSMRIVFEHEDLDLQSTLTNVWGAPAIGQELGKPKLFWFNAHERIRATVLQGYGKESEILFEPYVPLKEFIGTRATTSPLGFETHPLLGSTSAQLATHYQPYFETISDQEAHRQRERLHQLMGSGARQPPSGTVNIDLPPIEYGAVFTRVHPVFENDVVVEYRLGLSFENYPAAKELIVQLFRERFGQPQAEERRGQTTLVFSKSPRIELIDDPIGQQWIVKVASR